jgi:hypothetical protein
LVSQGLILSRGNGIQIFAHDPKSSQYGWLLYEYKIDSISVIWKTLAGLTLCKNLLFRFWFSDILCFIILPQIKNNNNI